jgi:ectoine hydroxylase-related dioxygenase (phytanoyl-CoA dioxygenase family)
MSLAGNVAAIGHGEREKFDRDGYLILGDSGCAESVLDGIVADLDGRFEGDYRRESDGVYYSDHRIMDAWRISENVKALALAPKLLSMLEQLYGRKPLPFQTLNFRWGTEQPAHSDAIHFNSMPSGYMCGAWVALEDIDMDCGPVVYYPGSHKLPELTMEDVGEESDEAQYSRYVADLIEREQLEPRYATIQKGQVFLWASNLLHGGSDRNDPGRTRHSQVTHFFFEGCKYYSPLLSRGSDVHALHPDWVSDESDDANEESRRRVREVVTATVPAGATVLVVSRSDDELLRFDGREGWHFPRDEHGAWAGHYPADSAEAIAHLEELRAKGAEYLVFPATSFWWLEHYAEFGQYLEGRRQAPARSPDCVIFDLR